MRKGYVGGVFWLMLSGIGGLVLVWIGCVGLDLWICMIDWADAGWGCCLMYLLDALNECSIFVLV